MYSQKKRRCCSRVGVEVNTFLQSLHRWRCALYMGDVVVAGGVAVVAEKLFVDIAVRDEIRLRILDHEWCDVTAVTNAPSQYIVVEGNVKKEREKRRRGEE